MTPGRWLADELANGPTLATHGALDRFLSLSHRTPRTPRVDELDRIYEELIHLSSATGASWDYLLQCTRRQREALATAGARVLQRRVEARRNQHGQ